MVCQTLNKYLHHSKSRFYCQQLWNAVIYCCYCIVFVDLLGIFEFTMYLWIFLMHIEECGSQQTNGDSFTACSTEFVTVHARIDAPVATLLALFHAQCCAVVFNKPNKNAECQLILLSFKPQPTVNRHGLNQSQSLCSNANIRQKSLVLYIALVFNVIAMISHPCLAAQYLTDNVSIITGTIE